ncbi:MAG TPA: cupin domain-containing protein [Gemmatales bacterium]|nr:cupin domain-containing protein [Gemmatales bacterium]
MMNAYTLLKNLDVEIEPPVNGILSHTIYQDERLKAVLFGFAAGQELSEHTASTPAIIHFLKGNADVVLGQDKVTASVGTWIHMPVRLPHSILAQTPVCMLLLLLKS